MNLFHDEETGPQEPIPGLPEKLPEGERILWQGSPSARALVIHAFHGHSFGGYNKIDPTLKMENIHPNQFSSFGVVFHGTTRANAEAIQIDGLKRMDRQAIHCLSAEMLKSQRQQVSNVLTPSKRERYVIVDLQKLHDHFNLADGDLRSKFYLAANGVILIDLVWIPKPFLMETRYCPDHEVVNRSSFQFPGDIDDSDATEADYIPPPSGTPPWRRSCPPPSSSHPWSRQQSSAHRGTAQSDRSSAAAATLSSHPTSQREFRQGDLTQGEVLTSHRAASIFPSHV